MGKVGFTPIQKKIFTLFSKSKLSKHFYFTGGTALSVCYLHHRQSDDLDFFTSEKLDDKLILEFMDEVAKNWRRSR